MKLRFYSVISLVIAFSLLTVVRRSLDNGRSKAYESEYRERVNEDKPVLLAWVYLVKC